MKKGVLILVIATVLLMVTVAFSKTRQTVVEEKKITLEAREQNGTKLYPLRPLCKQLDISIDMKTENEFFLWKGDYWVSYEVGSKSILNSSGAFITKVAPIRVADEIYVPLNIISYMFGYDVDLTEGIIMTRKANFKPPKAKQETIPLLSDITIIGDMYKELVKEEYYIPVINDIFMNQELELCDQYKDEISASKEQMKEMAQDLETPEAVAAYQACIDEMDGFYETLEEIERSSISEVYEGPEHISEAQHKFSVAYNQLLDNYMEVAIEIK